MAARAATLVAGVIVAVLALVGPTAARAEVQPDQRISDPAGQFTEVTITGLGNGQALPGAIAPDDFDPLGGYPDDTPEGSTDHDVSYAGTIVVSDPDSGRTGLVYCIDLETDTQIGVNYEIGDWTEANIPNLGFVEYILANYYPTTAEPAGATSNAQRAAAVQAAIWFFSDNWVLDPASPVRGLVEGIVEDAMTNGPLPEPAEPTLQVTPEEIAAPLTGEIVGPLDVEADGPATITSTGVEVFTDPDGVNLLQDGDEVQPGAQLWVRTVSDVEPQGFVLERVETLLEGTVFLYDGTNPDLDAAQKLVLARETELVVRAGAVVRPYAAGSLELTKQIGGSGAGFQDEVVVQIDCDDPEGGLDQQHTVTIAAGTPAGDHPRLITAIPAGSTCTISETADGDNDLVNVTDVVIDPASVTIVEGQTRRASITDTYARALGSLRVTKTIAGPAAGDQGAVTIQVSCDEPSGAFHQRFTIGAGAAVGDYPQPAMTGIPAGTTCTVTEPTTGETRHVALDGPVGIEPATVTIADDTTSEIAVTDTYVARDKHGHDHDRGDRGPDRGAPDRGAPDRGAPAPGPDRGPAPAPGPDQAAAAALLPVTGLGVAPLPLALWGVGLLVAGAAIYGIGFLRRRPGSR